MAEEAFFEVSVKTPSYTSVGRLVCTVRSFSVVCTQNADAVKMVDCIIYRFK